jgi:hypothetical protein
MKRPVFYNFCFGDKISTQIFVGMFIKYVYVNFWKKELNLMTMLFILFDYG